MAPSGTKAALKAIHQSIKSNKFNDARDQARAILEREPNNYQAHIFLAYALANTNQLEEAEQVYEAAAKTKPDDHQAWAGLVTLYEKQGTTKLSQYQVAAERLAHIYYNGDDQFKYKSQDVVDKFVDFARTQGNRQEHAKALALILPDGPVWDILEGRLPPPATTYRTIADITESEEKKRINNMIGERRTRVGARLNEVTLEVKREVFAQSNLEYLYRQLINWTPDDEVRRAYEEKLLQYCYDRLICASRSQKSAEFRNVLQLAEGMVIIKHPFKLAWDIAINYRDFKEIRDWDVNILREYCSFFPDSDLYKVITGFLTSKISPFPIKEPETSAVQATESDDTDSDNDDGGAPTEVVPVNDHDRLLMMMDGISAADSLFGYRLMGEYYQYLEEHETNVELMRKALLFLDAESSKTGLDFRNTHDVYSVYLGTALVFYQSPRHHQEAKALFDKVLSHEPTFTAAMIGVGLIYEEDEEYEQAIDFLDRALARDEGNLRIRCEAAWVKALKGDYIRCREELDICIPLIRKSGSSKASKELLALTQYRLGVCIWNIDPSRAARKSRRGAYAIWLDALKSDVGLAPVYTSLGVYFADYAKDKKRAKRCFQQAVELSPSEVMAAERLARSFADEGSWDHVELVAQRVVGSGKVKPPPGSKKKGISWPFAALGVAELNKQDFGKAVVSFQSALRMAPEDYHAWISLGESYANSGRYIAATKAILQAQSLEDSGKVQATDTWFTKYMLANIKRELGEFDNAITLYKEVLETHPNEEGVAIALMQTLVECGFDCLGKGFFGKSIQLGIETLKYADAACDTIAATFNFWKAVGDACSLFSYVQSQLLDFPVETVKSLIGRDPIGDAYDILSDVDGIDTSIVRASGIFSDGSKAGVDLTRCLQATILAHKRAIQISSTDVHAQAVAYYNLGWAEYQAHKCLPVELKKTSTKYLRASVKCFKRAIELEAGNPQFWNALGVVTSHAYPSVSQHAFVRSLHLNERSPIVWTNLGTLALLSNDTELATDAFIRAQSIDPEYAHAWVGQGLVAILHGNVLEARKLFTHAMGIADSSSVVTRRQYSMSMFDHMLTAPSSLNVTSLVQPLFALKQLEDLDPRNLPFIHLKTLFQERISDSPSAVTSLEKLSEGLEADYAATQRPDIRGRMILAKNDLARTYLASEEYSAAINAARFALQHTSDANGDCLTGDQRSRSRLSAHLTIGLALYKNGRPEDAVSYFEMALEETDNNPDAVCLLSQVLWATGTEEACQSAEDILLGVIEETPDHVMTVLLLGTMAILKGDEDIRDAVAEELANLRTSDKANTPSLRRGVAEVLGALAAEYDENEARVEAQREIVLYPHLPHGWCDLAATAEDTEEAEAQEAADMALKVALRAVPPKGQLEAEELATAFAGTGRPFQAQTGIIIAPWMKAGWDVLGEVADGG